MLLLLRNPRFRLLWCAMSMSRMAQVMSAMVSAWLALELTDSPFWVGAVFGAGGFGLLCGSIPGGVLADRLDRRKLLMAGGAVSMALAATLAVLALTESVRFWHLLAVGLLQGAVGAVVIPAHGALNLDLVGRGSLLKAVSTDLFAYGLMGILAPLVAGAIVRSLSEGWAYASMASLEFAAVGLLFGLRYRGDTAARSSRSPWKDLRDGADYVWRDKRVRALMITSVVVEAFGWSYAPMVPVMARDVLHVGVSGLGYMLAMGGFGTIAGAVTVASIPEVQAKGRLLLLGCGGFGVMLMLFSASRVFPLSMLLLAFVAGTAIVYEAALSTLLQTLVPDRMRGRVLSFQTLTWSLSALSGFHVGAIATAAGAPMAIGVGGGVLAVTTVAMGVAGVARLRSPSAEPP